MLVRLALGACTLALVAIFAWPQPGLDAGISPPPSSQPEAQARDVGPLADGNLLQPTPILMPRRPTDAVAINDVDPATFKSVGPDSPTTYSKGYIIGFCCEKSPAANGGWEQMSEVDKDAFVARFVNDDVTVNGPRGRQRVPDTPPINDVDPMTGELIRPDSPATVYKGHVIAFCCDKSPAANGGWERMSEAEKDAFVARFVE